jgi:hypothetical protein
MRSRLGVFLAAVVLACGGLLTACTGSSTEPSPVYALPVYKVIVGTPAVKPEAVVGDLRYVAAPD